MTDFTSDIALQATGQEIGATIMRTVGEWQHFSARTQQSEARQLGMSDLGGCREYLRATVTGDPKDPTPYLKWSAFVGTAVGDLIERALKERLAGTLTQGRLYVTLPRTKIVVPGSTDAIIDVNGHRVVHLKTKDGTAEVRRDGPPIEHKIQISGYLCAAIDEGLVPEGSTGHLVYVDRSGKDNTPWVWSLTETDARMWLEIAEDRLADVQKAIATSQRAPRDKPESWCWHVHCPFYTGCWEGYMPDGKITDPELIHAVELYDAARDQKKDADRLIGNAKAVLYPDTEHRVTGVTPSGLSLNWISKAGGNSGEIIDSIDVRRLATFTGITNGGTASAD